MHVYNVLDKSCNILYCNKYYIHFFYWTVINRISCNHAVGQNISMGVNYPHSCVNEQIATMLICKFHELLLMSYYLISKHAKNNIFQMQMQFQVDALVIYVCRNPQYCIGDSRIMGVHV